MPSKNLDLSYSVIDIVDFDDDGYPIGRLPITHQKISLISPTVKGQELSLGTRVLCKLEKQKDTSFKAVPIRVLEEEFQEIIGIFRNSKHRGVAGIIFPTDRRLRETYPISPLHTKNAKPGDLVKAALYLRGGRTKHGDVRILEILGHETDPKLFSLIAIHNQGIPHHFKPETIKEAQAAHLPPEDEKREDLRNYPLITIDGEDARDFDDAIWAEHDTDPKNSGGFHLIVAIADVAYYVKPESFLDQESRERGNSVYFPDRVVPMLPEALSNEMCSLKPNVPRATLAAHLWITASGHLLHYKFTRALIQSAARLTYTQVQNFHDKQQNSSLSLPESVRHLIPILFEAYQALAKERLRRGTLELDLPERQVVFDDEGHISKIIERTRLESHLLIEEFMITANVAAASFLSTTKFPCMWRIHDRPSFEKLEILRGVLKTFGFSLPHHTHIGPMDLEGILRQSGSMPQKPLIHGLILRSQSQAIYCPQNIGHFGLHLKKYAHFTSPIRRYADILVHRALISALNLGVGGLSSKTTLEDFEEIGAHISKTERTAMYAEREAMERYVTAYMEEHVGSFFEACISGVHRSGLFVELTETGANGFIPLRLLPFDRYILQEQNVTLQGRSHSFRLGDKLDVTLIEANSHTNSLTFSLIKVLNKSPKTKKPSHQKKHGKRKNSRDKSKKKNGPPQS